MLQHITIETQIINTKYHEIVFWLEPWGDNCCMEPGETLKLIGEGPEGGSIELDYTEETITAYGWPRSTLMAYRADSSIACSGSVPVPGPASFPPGMSTKGFVNLLFKGNDIPTSDKK